MLDVGQFSLGTLQRSFGITILENNHVEMD